MRSKRMAAACAVMAGGLFVGGVAAVAGNGNGNGNNGHGPNGHDRPPGHERHHGHGHRHHHWWGDTDWLAGTVGGSLDKAGSLVKPVVRGVHAGAHHKADKAYDIGTGVVVVAKDKAGHVVAHVADGKDGAMEWSHHYGAKTLDTAFDAKHYALHKAGYVVETAFAAKHWTLGWAHHHGAHLFAKAFAIKYGAMDWSHDKAWDTAGKLHDAKHEAAAAAAAVVETVHGGAGHAVAIVEGHVGQVEVPEKPEIEVPEKNELLELVPEPGEHEIVPDAGSIIAEHQPDPSISFTSPQVTVTLDGGTPVVTVEDAGSLQVHI